MVGIASISTLLPACTDQKILVSLQKSQISLLLPSEESSKISNFTFIPVPFSPLTTRWAQGGQILEGQNQIFWVPRDGPPRYEPGAVDAAEAEGQTALLASDGLRISSSLTASETLIPLPVPAGRVLWSPLGDLLLFHPQEGVWRAWTLRGGRLEEAHFPGVQGEIKGEKVLVHLTPQGKVYTLKAGGGGWVYKDTLRFEVLEWGLDSTGQILYFFGKDWVDVWPLGEGPLKSGKRPASSPLALSKGGQELIYWREGLKALNLESFEESIYSP